MQLRARQTQFRDNCVSALEEKGNTLGVAPTGAGKTVMLGAVIGKMAPKKAMLLQHRTELVDQNRRTFERLNPHIRTGVYNADYKETWPQMIFGMVQTVAIPKNLGSMPPIDFLGIDEAHHVAANSYLKTIYHFRELNPNLKIFGVTATPDRGDRKALRMVFDNCADQITLPELIASGHLVRPRCYVIDIGTQEQLQNVKKTAMDFDMAEVAAIMDRQVLNEKIVEKWREQGADWYCGDRRTVVFCSTIEHAIHVCETFRDYGKVTAAVVHSKMSDNERADTLAAFDRGEIQVLVNVAILTEGWDCQPVSCVILLRPSSYKSTMMQMIGRGLRKVDPELYPGIVKDDCIVLDFGTSLIIHGDLLMDAGTGHGSVIACPECNASVPGNCFECPICGAELREHEERQMSEGKEPKIKGVLGNFAMTEIDVLNDSPMKWVQLFDGQVMIASTFNAWGIIVNYYGRWHAIGGAEDIGVRHLANVAVDQKILALATADDFIRENGNIKDARKTKGWLKDPASEQQLKLLGLDRMNSFGLTKYDAACWLTWRKVEKIVRRKLEDAASHTLAA